MNNAILEPTIYFLQASGEMAENHGDSHNAHEPQDGHHSGTEVAGDHGAGHHDAAPKDLSTQLNETNTIAFLLVIVFFIWAINQFKLGKTISDSRQRVEDDIKAIESEKEKAVNELNAIKKRTANLNQEVEQIISEAKTTATGMSEKILEDAQEQVGKIVDTAKKRIDLEQKAAVNHLEKRLLNDALADAREELVDKMTAKDQQRSVDAFLDEMSTVS